MTAFRYGGDLAAFAAANALRWQPRQRIHAADWCGAHVNLSARFTNRPGRFDLGFTRYMAPLYDWASDPGVRQITTPKGAQISYTTYLANIMSYMICEEPGPGLYITSTAENAQDWSEREWQPRIEDCAPLKALVLPRRDAIKKLSSAFQTATLKFVGAQSENNLQSRPIRYLYCDEAERWPFGFLDQAKARVSSYPDSHKIFVGSTLDAEDGPTWQEWLNSSQHLVHVPCPNCREYLVLDFFKHIKWQRQTDNADLFGETKWDIKRAAAETYFECDLCGAPAQITQQHAMVAQMEARASNPAASPSHKGLHIPTLLSPYKTWGDIVRHWLEMKATVEGKKQFFNLYLGLPWSHEEMKITDEKLLLCRAGGDHSYLLRQCPIDPVLCTFAADVGEKLTHWTVEARAADGTAYLLDHGTVHQPEDLLTVFANLNYPIKGTSRHIRPTIGTIDSGYMTERIYRICANSGGALWPTKGSSAEFGAPTAVSRIPTYPQLLLYTYIDFIHKCGLYIDAISRRMQPHLWWPTNIGDDFVQGHAGQELKSKQTAQRTIKFWKPVHNDHYGDCSKAHRIIWDVLKLKYSGTAAARNYTLQDMTATE